MARVTNNSNSIEMFSHAKISKIFACKFYLKPLMKLICIFFEKLSTLFLLKFCFVHVLIIYKVFRCSYQCKTHYVLNTALYILFCRYSEIGIIMIFLFLYRKFLIAFSFFYRLLKWSKLKPFSVILFIEISLWLTAISIYFTNTSLLFTKCISFHLRQI